ncbi:2-dehydro-3-deoxygalactonokinase [Flavobacterium sp. 7A]|uniref:2-dehydro-3-deoxygalactonokinase n=1 Tax=Flavobacterium sp. 7A TaxID=2940571 RepID=UPI0022269478|nr:2-dehydro-3-deoxygalactonokinase [Flavobacterium sp. 7A]MCW2119008.1 2-dehydro-3-deoxygalactonokinase [Flavobacterium sp. 7A]
MTSIKTFVSVDWGTTNLRLRLVMVPGLSIVEEVVSPKGIKTIYNEWLEVGGDKEAYFLNFLKQQLALFTTTIGCDVTIVISGMASSSIGMRELPYAGLPFKTDGKSLYIEKIKSDIIPNSIQLISGVKSDSDVIRGEEVEIIGLVNKEDENQSIVFITPGTHSKHVLCEKGVITNFFTYMTGEVFSVISEYTILKASIEKTEFDETVLNAFEEGVQKAMEGKSLLNTLFKVRTNNLFKEKTNIENYYYLSGLMIGEELQTLRHLDCDYIKLCAGGKLFELYHKAITIIGLESKTKIINSSVVDLSVVKGQWNIIKNQL